MIHRKEKPFVCSRGRVANTSLAGPREGRERRAQHITQSHTMGNALAGSCAQWEALQAALQFPRFDLQKTELK